MRNFVKLYLVLLTFSFLFLQNIYSADHQSCRSFYAISSLRFHLDELLSSNQSKDFFSETDLLTLWDVAAADSKCSEDVVLARECYTHALQENSPETKLRLMEAQALLEESWKNLNPYWISSNSLVEKGGNQLHYILPKKSHLRKPLDKIFSDPNVINTPETFAEAGFITISQRRSGMIVASHPSIPGFLVKAYIRSLKEKHNWEWAVFRCWGASNIRALIKEKKLVHFVVPKKWIYPLTDYTLVGKDLTQVTSPSILVATYMKILDRTASRIAWKTVVTKRHVQELYCILSHGYSSCLLHTNIPYTTKGKFSCIDTEWPSRSLPYAHVHRFLSKKMANYWDYLVRTGGEGLPF
ncbi:MAG: hypothetical protein H0T62_00445 [Parachlamydiaceae bacterium]|nr:hypothetical protein [Parachlamydiaceae bacterium]